MSTQNRPLCSAVRPHAGVQEEQERDLQIAEGQLLHLLQESCGIVCHQRVDERLALLEHAVLVRHADGLLVGRGARVLAPAARELPLLAAMKVSRFDLLCRETLQRLCRSLTRRTYSLVMLEQSLFLGSLL